eukprot:3621101-Rhodomonas_salina.3
MSVLKSGEHLELELVLLSLLLILQLQLLATAHTTSVPSNAQHGTTHCTRHRIARYPISTGNARHQYPVRTAPGPKTRSISTGDGRAQTKGT